jgi:hypothetical protein
MEACRKFYCATAKATVAVTVVVVIIVAAPAVGFFVYGQVYRAT